MSLQHVQNIIVILGLKNWQINTCILDNDKQWLATGLCAHAKEVDDVHVAPDLLHYLHFLMTEMINDGDDESVPNDDESP